MRTNVRRPRARARWASLVAVVESVACLAGCRGTPPQTGWTGTIDTTVGGTIVVHNPKTGIWDSATAWRVVEEHRIGTAEGTGPDLFGQITALAADRSGRVYVFDGQVQELRVFDSSGAYVRTVGRRGRGPGEFTQVTGVAWDPHDRLWLVDPQNNRITIIDTSGEVVGEHYVIGGFIMMPWPGNIDTAGHYYTYVPDPSAGAFAIKMVEYDTAMTPIDTIAIPTWSGPRNMFSTGGMSVTVPYSPGLIWRLTRTGDIWFAETGTYRIFQRTLAGDTLREITRAFDPIPVSSADVDQRIAQLKWFTDQGGKIDRGRIPSVKPALGDFLFDDRGDLWVVPIVADSALSGRVFDLFDVQGRYLGRLRLPFNLSSYPRPVIRDDRLYGVTANDLGVEYVVIARIVKP